MKESILFLTVIISIIFSGCSQNEDEINPEQGKVIVLIYHRITLGEASNLYERSATDFESDLKYLKSNNIKTIGFNDLKTVKESGRMPSGHSAIISFDDGDYSWYITAMPLLKKYGMKATFFLWVGMIGRDSFIDWPEIEYMSNYMLPGGIRPFTFGSHSYSHQYLLDRKGSYSDMNEYNSFLDYELEKSKIYIEGYVPANVTTLALPFGDGAGDPDIIAAANRNGYSIIRTSTHGIIENPDFDPFNIPGIPMLDDTDPDEIGYYLNK